MHPRTHELLQHLAAHRAALQTAFAAVPPARRRQRPAPGRWSVAEVIDHLATVEEQIARLLRRKLDQARADGLAAETETAPVLDKLDAGALLDRERKFQAAPGSRPGAEPDPDAAWQRLLASRGVLAEVVGAADGLAVAAIRAPHPLFGEFDFHQWVAFVGLHESRHAAQVREIARATGP